MKTIDTRHRLSWNFGMALLGSAALIAWFFASHEKNKQDHVSETVARLSRPASPRPRATTLLAPPVHDPMIASTSTPLAMTEAELNRRLDLNQAGDLDDAAVLDGMQAYARAEDARPSRRWIWQSAAVLRLHPELADALGLLAARDSTGKRARALIIDVLSQVGHPRAQTALIAALDDPTVQGDPDYTLLLQRLAFVTRPTPATVEYADGVQKNGDDGVRDGARHALGAMAGHLASSTDADEQSRAQEIVSSLLASLRASRDPGERAHLVAGLGNAGQAAPLDVLLRATRSGDMHERRAATGALRLQDDPRSNRRLIELVADDAIMVQRAALRAIRHHVLDVEQQKGLTTAVSAEGIDKVNYAMLVSTADRVTTGSARRQLLQAVLAAANDDPRLRGRIRGMLRSDTGRP